MNVAATHVPLTSLSSGGGCACKLPLDRLEELLSTLAPAARIPGVDVMIGTAEGDDAAVVRLDSDRALVLTTDFFTPILDDPYEWGRVAATNAVSDVYAMGGKPIVALNLVAWPADTLPMEVLGEVLRGGNDVARDAGFLVAGGHTIVDPVPKYGMAVVGLVHPDRLLSIDRLAQGDALVLTKPLGTGVISSAIKNGGAQPEWVEAATRSMTTLNAAASDVACAAGVRAATDVTGFGLVGHLHRMARASGVAAELDVRAIPLLAGAREAVAAGFVPGGTRSTIAHIAPHVTADENVPADLFILAHDAQSSGGLLLGVAGNLLDSLMGRLEERDVPAAVIGRVIAGTEGRVHLAW